jgi:hypothetical protein
LLTGGGPFLLLPGDIDSSPILSSIFIACGTLTVVPGAETSTKSPVAVGVISPSLSEAFCPSCWAAPGTVVEGAVSRSSKSESCGAGLRLLLGCCGGEMPETDDRSPAVVLETPSADEGFAAASKAAMAPNTDPAFLCASTGEIGVGDDLVGDDIFAGRRGTAGAAGAAVLPGRDTDVSDTESTDGFRAGRTGGRALSTGPSLVVPAVKAEPCLVGNGGGPDPAALALVPAGEAVLVDNCRSGNRGGPADLERVNDSTEVMDEAEGREGRIGIAVGKGVTMSSSSSSSSERCTGLGGLEAVAPAPRRDGIGGGATRSAGPSGNKPGISTFVPFGTGGAGLLWPVCALPKARVFSCFPISAPSGLLPRQACR